MNADRWSALAGNDITCTYLLVESTVVGNLLTLKACSSAVSAYDAILANGVHVTVTPTLQSGQVAEISVPGIAGGILEEPISAAESAQMRDAFSWASTHTLTETDSQGRPELWYAMVYLRHRSDASILDQLLIRHSYLPLFVAEQTPWQGLRGFFLHHGDGKGVFVFALLPGGVYNLLRQDALSGNPLFDVIYLREPPASARAADGSVSYDALASVSGGGSSPAQPGPGSHHHRRGVSDRMRRAATEWGERVPWPGLCSVVPGDPTLTVVTDLKTTDPLFGGVPPASPMALDSSRPLFRPWGTNAGSAVVLKDIPIVVELVPNLPYNFETEALLVL